MRSSLSFNTNNVAMFVRAGKTIGSKADVQLEYIPKVEINNNIKTSSASETPWLSIEREYDEENIQYNIKGKPPVKSPKPGDYRSVLEPDAQR